MDNFQNYWYCYLVSLLVFFFRLLVLFFFRFLKNINSLKTKGNLGSFWVKWPKILWKIIVSRQFSAWEGGGPFFGWYGMPLTKANSDFIEGWGGGGLLKALQYFSFQPSCLGSWWEQKLMEKFHEVTKCLSMKLKICS